MEPVLPGVRWSVLLTGVRTGIPDLVATAVLVASGAAYLAGGRRLAGRGRRWPARHTAAFLAGLASIWVAVGSGLAVYDDSSVTLHVVQHVLLMMVAPPLLALGRPLPLAAQAAGRTAQVRITRLLGHRAVTVATHPLVGAVVYFGTMWSMLVDRPVYGYLVAHQPVHDASHVLLVVAGLVYWAPLVAPDASRHRLSHTARMLLLLTSMPLEALPGAWMRYQSTPIDVINTLSDTHTAGELLLVAATGACSVWLCAVALQWFAYAMREESREAAKAPTAEWTVPWWVDSPPAGGRAPTG